MSIVDILILTAAVLGVITIIGGIALSEGRKNFFPALIEQTQTRTKQR